MNIYIFDFKNIANLEQIQKVFSSWDITQYSDRCFEARGKEWDRTDILQLYQWIGHDGHIFVHNCQTMEEYYRQKNPRGRRRFVAQDSDLDSVSLLRIAQLQEALTDQT